MGRFLGPAKSGDAAFGHPGAVAVPEPVGGQAGNQPKLFIILDFPGQQALLMLVHPQRATGPAAPYRMVTARLVRPCFSR